MIEKWRPVTIDPFGKFYAVSNRGRVRRLPSQFSSGGVLRPALSNRGYHVVSLSVNNTKRTLLVYRLVARAFHGEKPGEGYVVAHCDGDSTNDRADNLQWKTHAENMQDMVDHGRSQRGTKAHGAKLFEDEVLAIRDMEGTIGCRALARQVGVAHTTILRIWTRERWSWL